MSTAREEGSQSTATNTGHGYEFLALFYESIEEGFFGGLKWGIAACFYQVLYELMRNVLVVTPLCLELCRRLCVRIYNYVRGRPPAIDCHELQVLISVLADTVQEYELVNRNQEQSSCKMLCSQTLVSIMHHIIEYLSSRVSHYVTADGRSNLFFGDSINSHSEVVFFIQLIMQTLHNILACVQSDAHHDEVITATRTVLMLIKKLHILLHEKKHEKIVYGPHTAWFSGQELASESR